MKRASTRFYLVTSFMLLMTEDTAATQRIGQQALHSSNPATRSNESRLAGLLPGRTTLSRAEALLGKASKKDIGNHSALWKTCAGDELILDLDNQGVVQAVRTAKANSSEPRKMDCNNSALAGSKWVTSKGIRLGSPASRVLQLYGEPDSRSPSTKNGQRLELLYYAFDWAGPDVPQVMQVLCTVEKDGKPGRVVEIMLAASSL